MEAAITAFHLLSFQANLAILVPHSWVWKSLWLNLHSDNDKVGCKGDLLNQWEGQNELITTAVSLKLYPFLHKANRSMTLGWVRRGWRGGGGGVEGGGKVLSEVVSKGLWQNYCMQPLCYFRLKIWFFSLNQTALTGLYSISQTQQWYCQSCCTGCQYLRKSLLGISPCKVPPPE